MSNSNDPDLKESIEAIQSILEHINEGEFSERIGKICVYVASISKSWDAFNSIKGAVENEKRNDQKQNEKAKEARIKSIRSSILNSIKFARINLDQSMTQALDKVIPRPRIMTKTDEVKRAGSLQTWFDKLEDPTSAMLEHYNGSSIPLDKYLVAGRWGHDYLRKRRINTEAYDLKLCEILPCSDNSARGVILNYGRLSNMIDALEDRINKEFERKIHTE